MSIRSKRGQLEGFKNGRSMLKVWKKDSFNPPFQVGCSLPGYGKDRDGNIVCYDCAGKMDADTLESLKPGEWMDLYLVNDVDGNYWVQNWPGSLKFNIYPPPHWQAQSFRNWYDIWFFFRNNRYHGVKYGNNTEIVHIQKVRR